MAKAAFWTLLALGAVIAGVIAWGAALPVEHTAARRIELRQPAEAVWHAITDVESAPEWRRGIIRIELLDDVEGRLRWVEHTSEEGLTLVAIQQDAPRLWVTRIDDAALPFGGTWTYHLTPTLEGTRLEITEDGEVYSPLFRFMARYVFGHTATLESYLSDLARKFGESAAPEPVR